MVRNYDLLVARHFVAPFGFLNRRLALGAGLGVVREVILRQHHVHHGDQLLLAVPFLHGQLVFCRSTHILGHQGPVFLGFDPE